MDVVRERLQEMRTYQKHIQDHHVANVKRTAQRTFAFIVGGFALAMVCLILARQRHASPTPRNASVDLTPDTVVPKPAPVETHANVLTNALDTARATPVRTTVARLDLAVIARMRGIRGVGATEDAAEAAVSAFETRLNGSLERMRRFAASCEVRTLAEEAAFLRASAHTVGAGSVIGLCRQLEAIAGGTKWSLVEAEAVLSQVEGEANSAVNDLRSWLRSQEINV
jgi:HPt (histidine-containing phosphotransfer) domain-containing protein